jgi:hypothetical protein
MWAAGAHEATSSRRDKSGHLPLIRGRRGRHVGRTLQRSRRQPPSRALAATGGSMPCVQSQLRVSLAYHGCQHGMCPVRGAQIYCMWWAGQLPLLRRTTTMRSVQQGHQNLLSPHQQRQLRVLWLSASSASSRVSFLCHRLSAINGCLIRGANICRAGRARRRPLLWHWHRGPAASWTTAAAQPATAALAGVNSAAAAVTGDLMPCFTSWRSCTAHGVHRQNVAGVAAIESGSKCV